MASLNKVCLLGNVGKAPEIKTMSSGDKVANFSIAMGESWKDKQTGEKKERTEWANVVVWGDGLVGVIERYVSKGSKIYIEGQLQTRKYEKDGRDVYTTEVVLRGMGGKLILLDGKKDGEQSEGGGGYSSGSQEQAYGGSGGTRAAEPEFDDSEIPFASRDSVW